MGGGVDAAGLRPVRPRCSLAHYRRRRRCCLTFVATHLLQLRAERKAAVAAGEPLPQDSEDEDEELDDSFYPSALPPRWGIACVHALHCMLM